MLALAVFGLTRLEEALAFADRAVVLKKRWQGLMIRGQTLLALNCPGVALQDLEASHKIRAHPYTKMLMGQAFASLRLMDTAIEILKRSTASVRFSGTLLGLAQCYRLVGQRDRADTVYEKAARKARQESSGMPCGSILAYTLVQLSRDTEAEEAANAMLAKYERETLALSTLAHLDLRRGDADSAEQNVRRMLLISPQSAVGVLATAITSRYSAKSASGNSLAGRLGHSGRLWREC